MFKLVALSTLAVLIASIPATAAAVPVSGAESTALKCDDFLAEETCRMVQCLVFGCGDPGEVCGPNPSDLCWLITCLLIDYCPEGMDAKSSLAALDAYRSSGRGSTA